MKLKILLALCGVLVLVAGCVSTVSDRTTAGVPFVKDRVENRYERSVDQAFGATKAVLNDMGTLVNETTLYNQTNLVKTVQGKVNQCNVWVRIEGIDPKPITSVTVQARTQPGGVNVDLAHEIATQIALKLAAGR